MDYECQSDYKTFESLKLDCDSIITSDNIEKNSALDIIKLYHNMEKLYLNLECMKDKEIEELKKQLDISKLTHKQSEMIESLSSDNLKCQREIVNLLSEMEQMKKKYVDLYNIIDSYKIKKK
tara:strand:+ start:797 stop:1162 length:366 start_codon:yes stop_codon:yes gene_type:complete